MKPQISPHHHRIKSDQPLNLYKLQQGHHFSPDKSCHIEERSDFDACISCGKSLIEDTSQNTFDKDPSFMLNQPLVQPVSTSHEVFRHFDKQDELKTLLVPPAGKPRTNGLTGENDTTGLLLLKNYFKLDGYASTNKAIKRNLNSTMSNILAYNEGSSSQNKFLQAPSEAQNDTQLNRRKNTRSAVSLSLKPGEISLIGGAENSFALSSSKWQRVPIGDMVVQRKQNNLDKESAKNYSDQTDSLDNNIKKQNISSSLSVPPAIIEQKPRIIDQVIKTSDANINLTTSSPNKYFKGTTILLGGGGYTKKTGTKQDFGAFHFLSDSYSVKKPKSFESRYQSQNQNTSVKMDSSFSSQLINSRKKNELISKNGFSPARLNVNFTTEGSDYDNTKKIKGSENIFRSFAKGQQDKRNMNKSMYVKTFLLNESKTNSINLSLREQKGQNKSVIKDHTKELENNNSLLFAINYDSDAANTSTEKKVESSASQKRLENVFTVQSSALDTKESPIIGHENNLSFECNSERSNFSFGEKSSQKEDIIENRLFSTQSSNPYKLVINEPIGNKSFSVLSEKKTQMRAEQLNSYFQVYAFKEERKRHAIASLAPNKMMSKLKASERINNRTISHIRTTSGSKRLEEEVKNLIEASHKIKLGKDAFNNSKNRIVV